MQKELYSVIDAMQINDRAYIYDSGNSQVFRHPGEMKACFANRKYEKLNLSQAVKQSVCVLQAEDVEKHLIVVVDYYDDLLWRNINMGMNLDVRNDNDCNFIICNLGKPLAPFDHPRCHCKLFEHAEGVGNWIKQMCFNVCEVTDSGRTSQKDISGQDDSR
jgi:hypothetical protein